MPWYPPYMPEVPVCPYPPAVPWIETLKWIIANAMLDENGNHCIYCTPAVILSPERTITIFDPDSGESSNTTPAGVVGYNAINYSGPQRENVVGMITAIAKNTTNMTHQLVLNAQFQVINPIQALGAGGSLVGPVQTNTLIGPVTMQPASSQWFSLLFPITADDL